MIEKNDFVFKTIIFVLFGLLIFIIFLSLQFIYDTNMFYEGNDKINIEIKSCIESVIDDIYCYKVFYDNQVEINDCIMAALRNTCFLGDKAMSDFIGEKKYCWK